MAKSLEKWKPNIIRCFCVAKINRARCCALQTLGISGANKIQSHCSNFSLYSIVSQIPFHEKIVWKNCNLTGESDAQSSQTAIYTKMLPMLHLIELQRKKTWKNTNFAFVILVPLKLTEWVTIRRWMGAATWIKYDSKSFISFNKCGNRGRTRKKEEKLTSANSVFGYFIISSSNCRSTKSFRFPWHTHTTNTNA